MTIIKNTTYIFIARVFNAALLLCLFVVVSRKLGAQMFGTYSFLHTIILTGTFFANFGLDTLMVREVSRNNKLGELYLKNILGLKILTSFVTIGIFTFAFSSIIPDVLTRRLLWIYSVTILFNSLSQVFWYYGDSFEKLRYHSILWVISNCFKVGIGITMTQWRGQIDFLIYGLVIAEFISFVISMFIIGKDFRCFGIRFDFSVYRKLLNRAYPIGIGIILGALYFRVDIVMLGLMKDQEYVGWYSASSKIIEGFTILPGSIILSTFPFLSKNFDHSKTLYWASVKKAIGVLLLTGLFVAAGLIFCARHIILIFYGTEYMMAIPILKILSIALFLIFINWFLSYVLISSESERYSTVCLAIMTILNVSINFFLIPKYGHVGAAWATVISEIILIFLLSFKVLKIMRMKPVLKGRSVYSQEIFKKPELLKG